MKTKTGWILVLVTLTVVWGGHHAYVLASEQASSIECDNGVVNIGDLDVDVQAKCGEPNSKNLNVWVYNFGPDEPIYTVVFENGRVVRILEDEWGS